MKDIIYIAIILAMSAGLVKSVLSQREISLKYKNKYSSIDNVSNEVERVEKILSKHKAAYARLKKNNAKEIKIRDSLADEIGAYTAKHEEVSMGVYEPFFDFDSSEKYKKEISKVREAQKKLLKSGAAIICNTEWEVRGSRKEGREKTKKDIALTARAFNNECEAAIANIKWNNANAMIKRIQVAQSAINKLNIKNDVRIVDKYLNLKIKELRLVHEMKEKKQEEKENEMEIRRLKKEEERLIKESVDAQNEEKKYKKMLEKAQKEVGKLQGKELDDLNEEINRLKEDLLSAQKKSMRSRSMAEQTKQGHVYIISNEGSFGKGVYKIGMTRRLDPMDRVKELGDASVPFTFDTHAMIFSKDAPGLETALHSRFEDKRLNLVNKRKEFFRVDLADIEKVVREFDREAVITKQAEAREYRETLALLGG